MIYLVSTILFSTAIVISFRLFTRFRIDNLQAITVNYLVAAIMCLLFFNSPVDFSEIPYRSWFPYAGVIGFTFILVFLVFALSAQKAGIAVTSVSSKMSVVIPVSVGIMAYAEPLNAFKLIGIIASLLAFYLTFRKNRNSASTNGC
jgi:drug/metabolite transporter (DMT)-like permease